MGKNKNRGGGSFRTLKKSEVPDNIKKMLGEQETSGEKAISGRLRDFVKMQESYHETIYNVAVIGAELGEMMQQIKHYQDGDDLKVTMKWNGMIIPPNILKAMTGRKNVVYKQLIHHLHSVKKSLLNDGLTEKQIKVIGEDGKYIAELPVKKGKINTGEIGG